MIYKILFSRRFEHPTKCAFLDRDGVINQDSSYAYRKKDIVFLKDVFEGCRLLKEKGYVLVVVTNQSGIGRGKYTLLDFAKVTWWMEGIFTLEKCPLAAVYFCPHHPDSAFPPFLKECSCRKPAPGLVLQAAEDLNLDLAESIFIGDRQSDMECAKAAGISKRFLISDNKANENGIPTYPSILKVAESL
ncbi:MAG: HAD family hydrolase [Burkholderiales bacterium]|nr:HAD family hydrolase [Burkholderiales bacterium]